MMTSIAPELIPERARRLAERSALRYLLFVLLVGGVFYLLPFLVERVRVLQPLSGSEWGLVLDHSYDLAGTNADVVVFGDSTALYGVDTPRLSQQLGMRVLNLPQSIGSLSVTGGDPLRRYLARNRAPRYVVLYFAPWNGNFEGAVGVRNYEGIEQVLRHGSGAEVKHVLRANTRALLTFPLNYYLVPSRLTRAWNGRMRLTALPRSGFQPNPTNASLHLPAHCVLPEDLLGPKSDDSLRKLVRDVASAETEVITVFAPVPECEGAGSLTARFGDAVAVLPAEQFANDGLMVHPLAAYTGGITDRVAEVLRSRMHPALLANLR